MIDLANRLVGGNENRRVAVAACVYNIPVYIYRGCRQQRAHMNIILLYLFVYQCRGKIYFLSFPESFAWKHCEYFMIYILYCFLFVVTLKSTQAERWPKRYTITIIVRFMTIGIIIKIIISSVYIYTSNAFMGFKTSYIFFIYI